jgi:hypothetical protein
MTKLSVSFIVASAAATAVMLGTIPAQAGVMDRDTETRGGMLGGAQTPTISKEGAFVHRGKAIVWVPNETLEKNRPQQRAVTTPNKVVVREAGPPRHRVKATTSEGAFLQKGKTTVWVSNAKLDDHLTAATPSGKFFSSHGRVALLGGANVHRDLLADLTSDYIVDSSALSQPPAVTKEGAHIHNGKTIQWVPGSQSGPLLGQ